MKALGKVRDTAQIGQVHRRDAHPRPVRSGEPFGRQIVLEEHRRRIEARIRSLQECRELFDWKVDVYGEHVRAGSAAAVWAPEPGTT